MTCIHLLLLSAWILCLRGIGGELVLLSGRIESDLVELLLKLGRYLTLHLYVALLAVPDIVWSVRRGLVVVGIHTPNSRLLSFVRILQVLVVRFVN